jgi:hypothetical protein
VIYLAVSYCIGTLVGMYIGYTGFRSYWMTKGASKLYDLLDREGLLLKNS